VELAAHAVHSLVRDPLLELPMLLPWLPVLPLLPVVLPVLLPLLPVPLDALLPPRPLVAPLP